MNPTALGAELPALLPAWLPQQRWFGAKGPPGRVGGGRRGDAVDHRGRSAARPVLLAVEFADGGPVQHYQLLVGRSATPRGELEHVTFGRIDGLVAYDGLWDNRVTGWLLEADPDRPHGRRGAVRARAGRADRRWAGRVGCSGWSSPTRRCAWGEQSILKLFRRVLPGVNPDLELHRALRAVGSEQVASLQGAIEGTLAGEPVTLAMLQDYAANSAEGWAMALASVRDLLAEGDLRADEVGGDFAAESARLGETVAVGARTSCGGRWVAPSRSARSSWPRPGTSGSTRRRRGARGGRAADAIRDVYDRVAELDGPVPTQRVHGDLHLGQTLRTPQGWLVIDFEGEPAAAFADRVRPDSALRDVAGMLRSFDYAAFHQLSQCEPAERVDRPGPLLAAGLAGQRVDRPQPGGVLRRLRGGRRGRPARAGCPAAGVRAGQGGVRGARTRPAAGRPGPRSR